MNIYCKDGRKAPGGKIFQGLPIHTHSHLVGLKGAAGVLEAPQQVALCSRRTVPKQSRLATHGWGRHVFGRLSSSE